MSSDLPPLVLAAHGSRDPRAAAVTRALAGAVGARRPGQRATVSFLDHALPRPGAALAAVERAGHRRAVLVPLLLTAAFHHRVDVPGVLAAARAQGLRLQVAVADPLGPAVAPEAPACGVPREASAAVPQALLAGLCRRLAEAPGADRADALVLAAAGTRDAAARATVALVAAALAERTGLPCEVAYASAAGPRPAAAVQRLRSAGARGVAVAAYFLAPGRLYDAAGAQAREAGAVAVAGPLGAAPELADLVLARADAAASRPLSRAA